MDQESGNQLRPMTPVELQMHEDLEWAMQRYEELDQQYHGEYVLMWKKQVIAHGVELDELLQQADTPEHRRDQLAVMEFPAFFEVPRSNLY